MKFKIGQVMITVSSAGIKNGKFVVEVMIPVQDKRLEIFFSRDAIENGKIHIELNIDDIFPF